MGHCFISFSTKDRVFADKILNSLENKYKIKCFICYRDILGGVSYSEQINIAISNCCCIVLLHSSNSDASDHVKREVELAAKYNKIIIPCKLDSATINEEFEYTLGRVHWLDLTEIKDDLIDSLAKSIMQVIGSPYKKSIMHLYGLMTTIAQSGATPDLLQEVVYALYDCIKMNPGKGKRKLENLYNSYISELKNIINNYNGDVANHHDNLLLIMNEIFRFCQTTIGDQHD